MGAVCGTQRGSLFSAPVPRVRASIIHNLTERNEGLRTALLNQRGYRVIRFSNHQVSCERQAVLEAVYTALTNC
jgi:hypothetical protein